MVERAREEAALIADCEFEPIDSVWGHRAGDPHRPGQEADAAFIRAHVHRLLLTQTPPTSSPPPSL